MDLKNSDRFVLKDGKKVIKTPYPLNVIVDTTTGVQYLVSTYGHTILVDENGKPLVDKKLIRDI